MRRTRDARPPTWSAPSSEVALETRASASILGNMTPANANNTVPDPPKRPKYTMRVLCIVNGPALTSSSKSATPFTPARPGRGWYVTRERWTVKL